MNVLLQSCMIWYTFFFSVYYPTRINTQRDIVKRNSVLNAIMKIIFSGLFVYFSVTMIIIIYNPVLPYRSGTGTN